MAAADAFLHQQTRARDNVPHGPSADDQTMLPKSQDSDRKL